MKKNYLLIAAAAAMFAACSETDTYKEEVNDNVQKAFTFSPYADKVTKAPNTNSSSLQDFYTVFGVYGFKNVTRAAGATDELVFENEPNEYFASDANGGTVYTSALPSSEWGTPLATGWYYENVRYWDKMANSYAFFAIAPYEADPAPALTVAATDANIQIGSSSAKYDISTEYNLARTVFSPNLSETEAPKASLTYSGFKKDYMLAEKSTVRTSDVMLNFHHILAKLNVKIKKSNTYKGKQELKIQELKIANLAKEGYFVFTTDFTTNGWFTNGTYPIDINTPYSLTDATTNYDNKYWIETLIFPQTAECKAGGAQSTASPLLTDRYLYIKYTIGNEVFEAYYDLAYVFNPALVYTAAEAATYNGNLAGHLSAGTALTAADAAAYNTALNPTTNKNADDVLTPAEADAYNATLGGAVAENEVKIAGSGFEFLQGHQYNLTLTVGPDPIHFDATVTTWVDEAEVTHTIN